MESQEGTKAPIYRGFDVLGQTGKATEGHPVAVRLRSE
jgi:hypothetical protein